MKPIIGISPSASTDELSHATFYRFSLASTYTDSVRRAGGIPVLIPPYVDDLLAHLDLIDGLILSGGGDIDPSLFNEQNVHEKTSRVDSNRDSHEITAYTEAKRRDLPTLCICRGIQVMNVAAGGTLIQHIPDTVGTSIGHSQHHLGKQQDETSHEVDISPEPNLLRTLLGHDRLAVNSYHHQSVEKPAECLTVVATAADGVIEALWDPTMRFGLGVQWHPEMLAHCHPDHAHLFTALVTEASQRP